MSISSALGNALSGLTVSSRSADVVSSNIANAMTEGYGVRSLDIGSRIGARDGSGAQVLGVLRDSDPVSPVKGAAPMPRSHGRIRGGHLRALEDPDRPPR
jgi:hypothetical protein